MRAGEYAGTVCSTSNGDGKLTRYQTQPAKKKPTAAKLPDISMEKHMVQQSGSVPALLAGVGEATGHVRREAAKAQQLASRGGGVLLGCCCEAAAAARSAPAAGVVLHGP